MEQFATPEVVAQLTGVQTSNGFTIHDAIRSGVENPDSSVGAYAGDEEAYQLLAPFFDNVIRAYHGHEPSDIHKRNLNSAHLVGKDLDPNGTMINSTRIRVGRNLAGFPFAPAISQEQRLEVERRILEALQGLEGDLAGQYYPLTGMDEATQKQLIADHFLFKEGDRFLASAGANRNWPEGRGIYHSPAKNVLVWVNEEDQLRIISMQNGGNVFEVFDRLVRLISALEQKLQFAYNDHLGYLSSCPTNLGTAMRASVHIKLPNLSKDPAFYDLCAALKLSVRGIHGEHSESEGGVYDISNKQRLGISEVEATNILIAGVKKLIALETFVASEA